MEQNNFNKKELKNLLSSVLEPYKNLMSVEEFLSLAEEVAEETINGRHVLQHVKPKLPEVGMYAFSNGKFSSDAKAYPQLLGVVACVTSDEEAFVGQRGLILLPNEVLGLWHNSRVKNGIEDEHDGLKNTLELIEYSKSQKNALPAIDWCIQNSKDNYQIFVPAVEQLKEICKNADKINMALKAIKGACLQEWIYSSTEQSSCRQYSILSSVACVGANSKCGKDVSTRFVIAF